MRERQHQKLQLRNEECQLQWQELNQSMSLVHKERDDALNKYQQREREVQLCESQL